MGATMSMVRIGVWLDIVHMGLIVVRRGVVLWCGVCFVIVSEDVLPC